VRISFGKKAHPSAELDYRQPEKVSTWAAGTCYRAIAYLDLMGTKLFQRLIVTGLLGFQTISAIPGAFLAERS
jgi:hypothetical protein